MQIVKRSLLWVITAAVPVVIAACYGPAYTFTKSGRVVDRTTGAGVANIAVSCADPVSAAASGDPGTADGSGGLLPDVHLTADDGSFYWGGFEPCRQLKFEDADGLRAGTPYPTRTAPCGDARQELVVDL
ncbi:MAG: hypothetical protein JXR83_04955 [Deltaproteobacteria bacterium]|nr:hypothetical protein [Deltaproteobacteria bacterium]